MTRDFIAGAAYGDYLPSGAWCAVIPYSHCVTHLGIVPFSPGEGFGPLFLRCTDVRGFRFAGQAHDTVNPACWERDGARWIPYNQPCVGVSPVIYDLDGVLHRSDGSVGSQGYRFVTPQNVIVSGDQSYGPFHGLFEYTELGEGLWIGQGATDGSGVQVLERLVDANGAELWILRQLELGTCRFIRANRVDHAVALAFTKPDGVVRIRTTMAELRAMPPIQDRRPGPVVNSPVKDTPVMPIAPNRLDVVNAVIAAHPEINRLADGPFAPNRGGITQAVAQTLGYPFGRKSRDRSATNLSDDALCYRLSDSRFEIYDILSGGDGSGQWSYAGTFADGENGYFATVSGAATPVPVPAPTPAPIPAVDLAPLQARLAALEAQVAALQHAEADALDQIHQLDATRVKLDQLPDFSRFARKGDRVEVSGRISFAGINRWGGIIS